MVRQSLASLLLAASATAQTIINYTQLPACAQQCSILQTAQNGCLPAGGAPVSNQATYDSCFCQSTYLRGLYTTTNGICNANCDSSDLTSIQQWYINFCNGGTATAIPPSNSASGSSDSSSTSTSSSSGSSSGGSQWWSAHWRWIVMVIVLLLGFALIIVIGVIYKRRHIRKRNAATAMAPPVVWGPAQHMHATRGFDYPSGEGAPGRSSSAANEKGKARYIPPDDEEAHGMDIPEKAASPPPRGSERKLKKILGR